MDTGQYIVIILSVLLALWYIIGSIINRKRGAVVFDWLSAGMQQFGKLSEARWIGSSGSGARLVVAQAGAPFQRVEVVFLLESREILPLWIVNHLRGKRDEMIVKASLRNAPPQELEAGRSGSRDFKTIAAGGGTKPFELLSGPAGFELARRGRKDDQQLQHISELLNHYEGNVWRVSLQRDQPHLILRANLPELQKKPAQEFFTAISQVVE